MENNTPEQKPLTLSLLVDRIWVRAYLDSKEDCAKWIADYASQQTEALQAEIERLKKRLDKDINALLHLGMVKDEQIERLKNIIKDGKLGN
jgi:hypothetical protein